jgi:glycosyltransferase involved in cell wall biosynthesis
MKLDGHQRLLAYHGFDRLSFRNADMRVLAVVPAIYDTSPGQRFRIEQWEPQLRKLGIEIRFEPFESAELHKLLYLPGNTTRKIRLILQGFCRRFHLLKEVRSFDAVYLFREAALLGPAIIERRIAAKGAPLVFDFDDAIFVPYFSPANGFLSLLKLAGKTGGICRRSAHVLVGNEYLASYARRFNPNVTLVPTTIDTDRFTPSRKDGRRPEVPVLGWTGSFSTMQHLATIGAPLQRLARRFPFRLRVITSGSFSIEGVDVELLQWKSASEVADLQPIDIGLMPLPEDRWSQGKCGCKALQYMALEIPTVCSPVGVNKEIIRDGVNGFLASSADDWEERLLRLLQSAELRLQLGRAGRQTVEHGYSLRVHAPRVADVFRSAVRGRIADGECLK